MRTSEPNRDIRLRLFASNADAAYRRRRVVFLVVWAVVSAALIWPLFGISALLPPLFGIPGPLAWSAACLVLMFLALLRLFLSEPSDDPPD